MCTCKQELHCDVTLCIHPASTGSTEIYIRLVSQSDVAL